MVKSVKKGILWSAVERFSTQGIQFLLSILIARQVLPSEYGLIAMLTIFMSIGQVFIDSGFSNALIQKKDRKDEDFSTVFYFSLIMSVCIYSLLFFLAPYIADFYNEPRLISIVRTSFITLIIGTLYIVQRTKMTLEMDFKTISFISLAAIVISGVLGVTLAYQGYGVWALVSQSISSSIITCTLFLVLGKGVRLRHFSGESFRSLFSFGSKILCTSLLDVTYSNIYNIIIGKVYSTKELGLYNRSYTLSQFPSRNIYNVCSRVIYPKFCSIQEDKDDLFRVFLNYIGKISFFVVPLMFGMASLSNPFIQIVLSEKWIECAPYLSILCISYSLFPIMNMHFDFLTSMGYSNLALKAEILKKIIGAIAIASCLPFGVLALCVATLVNNISDILIISYFCRQTTHYSLTILLKRLWKIFLCSSIMFVSEVFLQSCIQSSGLELTVGIPTGIVVYIVTSYIFRTDDMLDLLQNLKSLIKKNENIINF